MDLNSANDGVQFETNFCIIFPEELDLGKKNTDNHEASFLDSDIKIRDAKFQVDFFDKRHTFAFSIVTVRFNSRNMPSISLFYIWC